MTSLRLAIDASGMRSGAADAQRALDDVGRASQGTAQRVDDVNRALRTTGDIYGSGTQIYRDAGRALDDTNRSFGGLNRSVGVASEALQIGGRVRLVTQEFQALGTGAGDVSRLLIIAGQGLVDFVQIGERLKTARLAEEVGKTATGFKGFIQLITRNPLLSITVAVGALAAAMSLLSKGTDDAVKSTDALSKAVEALDSQRFQESLKTRLGIPLPQASSASGELSTLLQAIEELSRASGPVPVGQLSRILGESVGSARDRFGPNVTQQRSLQDLLDDPNTSALDAVRRTAQGGEGDTVTRSFALEQLQERARLLAQKTDTTAQPLDDYLKSLRQETELLGQSEEKRQQSIAVIQAENIAKQAGIPINESIKAGIREEIALQQQLVQAQELARQSGEAIGSAFFSIVTGANNARQAVAQLVQQLASLAQQQVVRGLGNAAAGLFSRTPAQSASTPGLGSSTPGPYADGYQFG